MPNWLVILITLGRGDGQRAILLSRVLHHFTSFPFLSSIGVTVTDALAQLTKLVINGQSSVLVPGALAHS